MDEDYPARPEV